MTRHRYRYSGSNRASSSYQLLLPAARYRYSYRYNYKYSYRNELLHTLAHTHIHSYSLSNRYGY